MTPIGPRHAAYVKHLTRAFDHLLDDVAVVSVQDPVHLSEYSEPQPDLALLAPPSESYRSRHPGPKDILLIVEVAQTSADPDRRVKVPLYARAAVREVWLVDLQQGTVTANRDPAQDGYRSVRVFQRGETITLAAFPGRPIGVEDLLPE